MAKRRGASSSRKNTFDVDALWAIKRIGAPTLAADGTLACAPVTSYSMHQNVGSTELWLFPTGLGRSPIDKPRRLTSGEMT